MENTQQCNRCDEQLQTLRALDFAIRETVLYLDAYPDCKEALAYYHALCEEHEKQLAVYQSQCGPLTPCGNRSRTSWDWVRGPWPWEPEAN